MRDVHSRRDPLPIDNELPRICDHLQNHASVVIVAPPGVGKSTRIPAALLESGYRVLVVQPRRVAARSLSERVAYECNSEVGHEVGYRVRFEGRESSATRLLYVTEGILIRMLIDNPELQGFDVVIIDEFHERSLLSDLALALLRDVQREWNSNLRIVVMSATLESHPVKAYLGCDSIVIQAPHYPLEVVYLDQPLAPTRRIEGALQRVVELIIELDRDSCTKDILVFLPGSGEIRRCMEALSSVRTFKRDVLPLYSALPLEQQIKAIRNGSRPRVVIATNIAESSLTVDGVNVVIDSGLERVMRAHAELGTERLFLERISRHSSEQRAGRAARQGPGRVFRLWTSSEHLQFSVSRDAEIHRRELSQFVLNSLEWSPRGLEWVEHPPLERLQSAERLLRELGLIDQNRHVSELGRRVNRSGWELRTGSLLELAFRDGQGAQVALGVLALESWANVSDFDQQKCSSVRDAFHALVDLCLSRNHLHRSPIWRRLEKRFPDMAQAWDPEVFEVYLLRVMGDRLCRIRSEQVQRAVMVTGREVRLAHGFRDLEFFVALDVFESRAGSLDMALWCPTSRKVVRRELPDQFRSLISKGSSDEADSSDPREALRLQRLCQEHPEFSRFWARFLWAMALGVIERISQERIQTALFEALQYGLLSSDVSSAQIESVIWTLFAPRTSLNFEKEIPSKILVPSGQSHAVDYPFIEIPQIETMQKDDWDISNAISPKLSVRLQELFGWHDGPRIANGTMPLVLELLSPSYRPVQTTRDLRSFWSGAYFEVRKELRARYPKHSWPEDPLTAIAEAKGRRRTR